MHTGVFQENDTLIFGRNHCIKSFLSFMQFFVKWIPFGSSYKWSFVSLLCIPFLSVLPRAGCTCWKRTQANPLVNAHMDLMDWQTDTWTDVHTALALYNRNLKHNWKALNLKRKLNLKLCNELLWCHEQKLLQLESSSWHKQNLRFACCQLQR